MSMYNSTDRKLIIFNLHTYLLVCFRYIFVYLMKVHKKGRNM
jgi:hypothetical protein